MKLQTKMSFAFIGLLIVLALMVEPTWIKLVLGAGIYLSFYLLGKKGYLTFTDSFKE